MLRETSRPSKVLTYNNLVITRKLLSNLRWNYSLSIVTCYLYVIVNIECEVEVLVNLGKTGCPGIKGLKRAFPKHNRSFCFRLLGRLVISIDKHSAENEYDAASKVAIITYCIHRTCTSLEY